MRQQTWCGEGSIAAYEESAIVTHVNVVLVGDKKKFSFREQVSSSVDADAVAVFATIN